MIAYGSLGFVAVQICYFIAIDRLPVGVALLFEYMSVVLVAVYAAVLQHRPQPRAVWVGVTLAVVGVVVLTQPWSGFRLNVWGSVAGAGAALGCAAYFLIGERGTARLPVLELTAYGAGVGAIVLAFVVTGLDFSVLGARPFGAIRGTGHARMDTAQRGRVGRNRAGLLAGHVGARVSAVAVGDGDRHAGDSGGRSGCMGCAR